VTAAQAIQALQTGVALLDALAPLAGVSSVKIADELASIGTALLTSLDSADAATAIATHDLAVIRDLAAHLQSRNDALAQEIAAS